MTSKQRWRTALGAALALGVAVGAMAADEPRAALAQADRRGTTPFRAGASDSREGEPIPAEVMDEAVEIVGLFHPKAAQKLESLRRDKPIAAADLIRKHLALINELRDLRRTDREMFSLKIDELRLGVQAKELAPQVSEAKAAKDLARVKELTDQMRAKLDEQFEKRQILRQREIDRLQRQLDNLKKQLSANQGAKPSLIAEQMDKLMREQPEW